MDSDEAKELTNKIRWAIGSTLDGGAGGGSSLNYREQMWLAGMLTSSIADVISALRNVPGNGYPAKIDRALIQNLLTQVTISD